MMQMKKHSEKDLGMTGRLDFFYLQLKRRDRRKYVKALVPQATKTLHLGARVHFRWPNVNSCKNYTEKAIKRNLTQPSLDQEWKYVIIHLDWKLS